jgi:hypothetical protein
MFQRKKLGTLLLVALLGGMAGCKQYLDVNVDPNRPSDVTLQTLMPTVQQATASFNYSTAYTANQYIQQIGGGVDDQTVATMEAGWSTLYLTVVPNLRLIIAKAQEPATTSPAYVGIAKTLLAFNLGMATTYWENIPYSQADAEGTFRPPFDTQESIQTEVQKLLDEAIVELKKDRSASLVVPATDDLVYGGDLTKWIKLAYTIKARFYLHTTKKGATQAAQSALAALANGMTSTADDFQLVYRSGLLNPWHQVALANYTGNLTIAQGAYFINLMNTTTYPTFDPRLPLLAGSLKAGYVYATPQSYQGTRPNGAAAKTVDFTRDTYPTRVDAPIQLVTYAEAKFIEAEARFLANGGIRTSTGSTADAYAAYLEGTRANLLKLGVSTTATSTYLAAPDVAVGVAGLKLERIMVEKYKALFLNGEAWTDLRRYDYDPAVYRDLALPERLNPELNGRWIQRVNYPVTETARNAEVTAANFKPLNETMWLFK